MYKINSVTQMKGSLLTMVVHVFESRIRDAAGLQRKLIGIFIVFYHTKQCKNIKHFLPFLLMFCQWCHLHSTKSFQSHVVTTCSRNSYSLPQVNILFGNKRGLDVQESEIQAQRKYICKHNPLLTERGAFKVQRKKN